MVDETFCCFDKPLDFLFLFCCSEVLKTFPLIGQASYKKQVRFLASFFALSI